MWTPEPLGRKVDTEKASCAAMIFKFIMCDWTVKSSPACVPYSYQACEPVCTICWEGMCQRFNPQRSPCLEHCSWVTSDDSSNIWLHREMLHVSLLPPSSVPELAAHLLQSALFPLLVVLVQCPSVVIWGCCGCRLADVWCCQLLLSGHVLMMCLGGVWKMPCLCDNFLLYLTLYQACCNFTRTCQCVASYNLAASLADL